MFYSRNKSRMLSEHEVHDDRGKEYVLSIAATSRTPFKTQIPNLNTTSIRQREVKDSYRSHFSKSYTMVWVLQKESTSCGLLSISRNSYSTCEDSARAADIKSSSNYAILNVNGSESS
jgi:hypothetical protein